jgi:hypothetical protein
MQLRLPLTPIAFAASAALIVVGCASSDAAEPDGRIFDGGAVQSDSGYSDPRADAGSAIDASSVAPPLNESSDLNGIGCFDFRDTDLDGDSDCDDPDCAGIPLCCVGSASENCCRESTTSVVSFSACEGVGSAALSVCAGDARLFGTPTPELRDGAFLPLGDDHSDSGLVLSTRVDPRVERLEMRARISAGEGCAECIDAVAFALSAESIAADAMIASPDLAVMASTAHGEIRLFVGGAIARTATIESVRTMLGAAMGDAIDYEFETTPQGLASLRAHLGSASAVVFADIPYSPRGPSSVLLYGRGTNRAVGDPPPAAIHDFALHASICDSPQSLTRASEPILPDDIDRWWLSSDGPRSPSVVVYDDAGDTRSLMAFEYRGRIHLAGGIADGRFRALADPENEANAKVGPSPDEAWRALGVFDPELVRADDHWEIWFTAVGSDGKHSIGRAVGGHGFSHDFHAASRLLPTEGDEHDWDSPSYLELNSGTTSQRFLAARRGTEANAEIIIHEIEEGGALAPLPAETLDDASGGLESSIAVRRVASTPLRFDADEVGSPALVHYGGVFRLYYAGRRGTRWAIGLAISQDGRFWHAANDDLPVLSGSGTGFDALSVDDPEPVLVDGELRLYFTGTDGARTAIGLSRVRVPLDIAP